MFWKSSPDLIEGQMKLLLVTSSVTLTEIISNSSKYRGNDSLGAPEEIHLKKDILWQPNVYYEKVLCLTPQS